MKKITNVMALEMAIEMLTVNGFDKEALEKLENIKTSYEKKSHSEKKPTQTQLDNERLKVVIADVMEVGTLYTVTDVTKLLDADYTNQKISALLNAMVKAEILTKTVDKRKSYFAKA